jgi:hypothetical protein
VEDDPELNMLVGPPDRPVGGASCGRPPDARHRRDERVLNIYNWNDYYIDDRTIPPLQAQSNLRVNYDVYSSNEDLLARMRPARPSTTSCRPAGSSLPI